MKDATAHPNTPDTTNVRIYGREPVVRVAPPGRQPTEGDVFVSPLRNIDHVTALPRYYWVEDCTPAGPHGPEAVLVDVGRWAVIDRGRLLVDHLPSQAIATAWADDFIEAGQ